MMNEKEDHHDLLFLWSKRFFHGTIVRSDTVLNNRP